jgi:hypothetical protein
MDGAPERFGRTKKTKATAKANCGGLSTARQTKRLSLATIEMTIPWGVREQATARTRAGWLRGYTPTLCDKTAKDGAPERFGLVEGRRFALCANAHLSDDRTVAKMGHPIRRLGGVVCWGGVVGWGGVVVWEAG